MDMIVKDLQSKVEAAEPGEFPLLLRDIRPMHSFSWLCDDAQTCLAKQWTEKILSKVGVCKDDKPVPCPAKKKQKIEKSKGTGSDAVVDAYFS